MVLFEFTNCDPTSRPTFKGILKIKPIKTMQTDQIFQSLLVRLGETWEVSNDVLAGFESF